MLPKAVRLTHDQFLGRPFKRARFSFGSISFYKDVEPKMKVIVSKKTARRAVDRNRIRRRLTHALAKLHPQVIHSVAVYPTKDALRTPFPELLQALGDAITSR
jgi:ribonuclease P protein component